MHMAAILEVDEERRKSFDEIERSVGFVEFVK